MKRENAASTDGGTSVGMRWVRLALVVLVGAGSANCACSSNRSAGGIGDETKPDGPVAEERRPVEIATETVDVKLPAAVDAQDLDATEKQVLVDILKEQFDPCGKPRSFHDALDAGDACDDAKKLAATAVGRIADGWSKKQVVGHLLAELAKRARRFDFDLEGVPCTGGGQPGKRVIVEFTDFQCPHCAKAFGPAKELAERHGARVCMKQLPLDFHTFAKPAALAALAAHRQGKYWEYAVAVFRRQDGLSEDVLKAIAKEVGLDLKRFEADRASREVADALARDVAEAELARVEGTPSFFVDGLAVAFEDLETALTEPMAP